MFEAWLRLSFVKNQCGKFYNYAGVHIQMKKSPDVRTTPDLSGTSALNVEASAFGAASTCWR